jgi:hypothetical protein
VVAFLKDLREVQMGGRPTTLQVEHDGANMTAMIGTRNCVVMMFYNQICSRLVAIHSVVGG